MTAVGAMVTGGLFGLGVYLGARALRPALPPLARVLAEVERPRRSVADLRAADTTDPGWGERFRDASIRLLAAVGATPDAEVAERLRVLGRSPADHAARKLAGGLAGFLLPLLGGLLLWAGGAPASPVAVGLAAAVLGAAGFFWADLGLADAVERRRRAFRHALSAYLDLVSIVLAGGGGLETALQAAADAGDGWAFSEIRGALRWARLGGRSPWEGFADLGRELRVTELRELAAAATLAGDQGARIRASLGAKADALRAAQAAAVEVTAESATEKMLIPVVALVVGMILFVGFGVVEAIATPTPLGP